MGVNPVKPSLMLVCVIVNFGSGSGVLKIAKQNGVPGGTIMLGRGTVNNRLLELLDLSDIRKEIVLMIADEALGYAALEKLDKHFHFSKPYHGIAFTVPVLSVLGASKCAYEKNMESCGVDTGMYHSIFVIVDKGKGDEIMDVATKAGARGGTIMQARGSGLHENSKLFQMEIEPEKEVVLILTKKETTDSIVSALCDEMHIDKPGQGILFVQDVGRVYGLQ